MNNAFYGKTIDIRNYQDIKLIKNNDAKVIKLQSKPNFVNTIAFSDTLKAVKMEKKTIVFNKPMFVGTAILEISKLTMYDFYYNGLKKKYKENVELLIMDTDGFKVKIKTEDLWMDIKNDPEFAKYFDFNNAAEEHPLYKFNPENDKVLGKMKNESFVEMKVKDENGEK